MGRVRQRFLVIGGAAQRYTASFHSQALLMGFSGIRGSRISFRWIHMFRAECGHDGWRRIGELLTKSDLWIVNRSSLQEDDHEDERGNQQARGSRCQTRDKQGRGGRGHFEFWNAQVVLVVQFRPSQDAV